MTLVPPPPRPLSPYRAAATLAAAILPALLLTPLVGQTPVADPVPSVQSSGIAVHYRTFAVPPRTNNNRPYARINHVKPFTTNWLGVNDLNGPLYWIDYQGQVVSYLDFRSGFPAFRSSPGLGTGLASFAVHPEFATNGKFYTAHTEAPATAPATIPLPLPATSSLQGVVIEWTADNPSAHPFAGTRRELLRIDFPGTIHGLQELAFRPDIGPGHPDYGLLFICVGEGQVLQRGPLGNTGTPTSPLGTLLRIDPLGTNAAGGRYGIPADNPFVGQVGAIPEIYAYGFRNPHRITWNEHTGDLYLTDIGEQNVEELNIVVAGGHHGWPVREGTYLLNPSGDVSKVYPLPADDTGFVYPVAMYDHADGAAIAGGFVYRGSRIPQLTGMYLASDVRDGTLWLAPATDLQLGTLTPLRRWALTADGRTTTNIKTLVGNTNRTDTRLGTDHFGEIYLLTKQDGIIRKLVAASEPATGLGWLEGRPWVDGWVDSDSASGQLNVAQFPWVYSAAWQQFVFVSAAQQAANWYFIPR
jgi:hypothetical protein